MTHLVITESSGTRDSEGSFGSMQALDMPPLAETKVVFGTAYTIANDGTRAVRLFAIANCWVGFAKKGQPAPTAADPNFPLDASRPEVVRLSPGDQIIAAART